jgi:hypothetical protein
MSESRDFRDSIQEAIEKLNLPSENFKLVSPYSYEKILISILTQVASYVLRRK